MNEKKNAPFSIGDLVIFGGFQHQIMIVTGIRKWTNCQSGWLVEAKGVPCPVCHSVPTTKIDFDSDWFKRYIP